MNKTFNIAVKNKIAVLTNDVQYICGNSDFVVDFDFDDDWLEHRFKTARFIYGGQYVDVVFEGNQCAVPVISNTYSFLIGVFAGNLRTTTPAYISAKKSILCEGGLPAAPTDDVYAQMMELFNDGMVKVAEVEAKADATEQAKVDAQAAQKAAEEAKEGIENTLANTITEKKAAETARKGAEEAQQKAEETVGSCVSYLEQGKSNAEKAQARKNIGAVKTWDDLAEELVEDTENEESIIVPLGDYYFDQSSGLNGEKVYIFTDDTGAYYRELESGILCVVLWQGEIYECVSKRWGNTGYIGNRSLGVDGAEDTGEPFYIAFVKSLNRLFIGTTSISEDRTYTVKAYIPKAVISPLPAEFLPDISWDDVKNKPFSKTEFGDTLTWDGNTEGLDVCDQYYRVFGKVKSIAENIELFTPDNATYLDSDGGAYTGTFFTQTDDHINFGHVIITLKDNAYVPYCGMSFPRKGVYFYGRVESADSGFVHVSSFTVPGFNFKIEEIDEELLPDSVVQNGATSLTLASPSGNLFNITVDNNGNITATKVTT